MQRSLAIAEEAPPQRLRTVTLVGRALAVAFAVCFVTGLLSHAAQHPQSWPALPTRPVWGYRVTQGLHVATGIACVPLLLVKLWLVYGRLFAWPPVRGVLHALERLSVFVLVASALFQLVSGLVNIAQWYPWSFFFPETHYAMAWVSVGALVVHIAVKAPQRAAGRAARAADDPSVLSRRQLLAGLATAVGLVTIATVGQTLRPLQRLALLAPRRPGIGAQGLPVNRSATAAGVVDLVQAPGWRLEVVGPRPLSLDRAALEALPQHEAALPIACVEGWSAGASWRGVRVRDLAERAGLEPGTPLRVVSAEPRGLYAESLLEREQVLDPLTLLALDVNGEPLSLDHGYPARLITPNRPGVLQTKWVQRLEPA